VLPLGFAAFLVFGVVLVLVGANQAALARDLSLDLSRSGLLGAALVLGIGAGVVGAGPLVDRYPRRPLWVFSTGLAGAALLGVSPQLGFERMLAQLALVGLALGLYDTLVSTLVAQRFRERALRPMSVIHSAATLGAMLGPVLTAWLSARGHWTLSFHAAGYAHLALAAAGLWLALPAPDREPARAAAEPARGPVFSRALIPFALASFGYVGIESALTVFAVPYASQGHGLPVSRGLASITAFWMGLFGGRLIPLALPFAPGAGWIAAAGAAGAASLAIGRFVPAPELVFGAAGLALGCVYPLAIALAAQRFPEARGTATGLTAGAGALGGFAVPWLHGALGDRFGASAAVAALAFWSLLVGAAALLLRRRPSAAQSA
jgi:MFS family permease